MTLEGDCHNLWNFFRHDMELLPLVYNKTADCIFKHMLDDDYTLIAGNIINRSKTETDNKRSEYGDNWHTDSRYLGDQRLAAGFNFGLIIMLDAFSKDNGATQFVPSSHKLRNRPDRNGDYKFDILEGEIGTMVLFDSGLWHRGGPSSTKSRWAVFSMYGPWFMKPYFRFPEMLGPEIGKTLSPELRRLFHYNSNPPLNEDERINTLISQK